MNDGVLLYSMSRSSCHVGQYVRRLEEEFFLEAQNRLAMRA